MLTNRDRVSAIQIREPHQNHKGRQYPSGSEARVGTCCEGLQTSEAGRRQGRETDAVAAIAEHFLNFVFTRVVNH
jgi:hypothetical protein